MTVGDLYNVTAGFCDVYVYNRGNTLLWKRKRIGDNPPDDIVNMNVTYLMATYDGSILIEARRN